MIKHLEHVLHGELEISLIFANLMSKFQEQGLQGFKRMFRYYSREYLEHMLSDKNYAFDVHRVALPCSINYSEQKSFTSVLEAIKFVHDRIDHFIEDLLALIDYAAKNGHFIDVGRFQKRLKCEYNFRKNLYRMVQELTNTNGNPVYIQQKSEEMHEKYKRKEKDNQGRDIY